MPLAAGFFYFPSTACSAWPIVLTRIKLKIVKASQLVSFLPGYHTFMEAQALHFTQALPNALHTAQLTRLRPTSPIAARSLPTGAPR